MARLIAQVLISAGGNWRAGQETRPYKAILVLSDAMATAAMKPHLSLWNQIGLLKTP